LFYFTDPDVYDLTENDLTANDLTEILKVYMLVCPTCSQWCEPYSELACIVSTLSMGFQLGTPSNSEHEFAGDYEIKGCSVYLSGYYKGLSFYGTGKLILYPNY
jgi:hypothetical protein